MACAFNGEDALSKLTASDAPEWDLVLMDVQVCVCVCVIFRMPY